MYIVHGLLGYVEQIKSAFSLYSYLIFSSLFALTSERLTSTCTRSRSRKMEMSNKNNGVLAPIVVGVALALLVGDKIPWWWGQLAKNQPLSIPQLSLSPEKILGIGIASTTLIVGVILWWIASRRRQIKAQKRSEEQQKPLERNQEAENVPRFLERRRANCHICDSSYSADNIYMCNTCGRFWCYEHVPENRRCTARDCNGKVD